MKIKICGIKSVDEFRQICDLNFDFFGLIFAESKRQVNLQTAINISEIGAKFNKHSVLVFATYPLGNMSLDEIFEICKTIKPFAAQIYGDFDANFRQKLNKIGVCVWKVYSLNSQIPKLDFELFDLPLFDCKGDNLGGNGISFEWEILKNFDKNSFIMAGGIGESNVKFASSFEPFAVDINSLVENNFGTKERKKIVGILEILGK